MNGWALQFTAGTGDRVDLGLDASLNDLDPFTWMAWVRASAFTSNASLVTKTGTGSKLFRQNLTTGDLSLVISRATTAATYTTNDVPLGPVDSWRFIATVFDSTRTQTGYIYSGSLTVPAKESTYATATAGSGAVTADATGTLIVGNRSAFDRPWVGNIGPVAVLRQYLSLADVQYWQHRLRNPNWRPGRRWQTRFHGWLGRRAELTVLDTTGFGNLGTVTTATPVLGPPLFLARRRGVGSVVAGGGVTVTPTTVALTTSTFAPTVSTPRVVTPSTRALALTTFAPTVSTPRVVTPSTRALALTTFAPTVSTPRVVTPATAALTLAGFAPSVNTGVRVTVNPVALTIATFAPVVSAAASATVIPATAVLTISAFAPDVATSGAQGGGGRAAATRTTLGGRARRRRRELTAVEIVAMIATGMFD